MSDQTGRTPALIFAILATVAAIPELFFAFMIGMWGIAVPCDSGGAGSCTPIAAASAGAGLLLLIAPIVLWLRVRRPASAVIEIIIGILMLIVVPAAAFILINFVASSVG